MKQFEDRQDIIEIMKEIDTLLAPLLIIAEQQRRSNGYVNDTIGEPFDEDKDSGSSE